MYNCSRSQDTTVSSPRIHLLAAFLWSISLYPGEPAAHPRSEPIVSRMPYAPAGAWIPWLGLGTQTPEQPQVLGGGPSGR